MRAIEVLSQDVEIKAQTPAIRDAVMKLRSSKKARVSKKTRTELSSVPS